MSEHEKNQEQLSESELRYRRHVDTAFWIFVIVVIAGVTLLEVFARLHP